MQTGRGRDGPPKLGGIMGYGDDIISSDNFEADDEDDFDPADYESELTADGDIDWEDNDELAGR